MQTDVRRRAAETLEDPRSLIRLNVQRRRPERLGANFVGEAIDRGAKLVDPGVDLVEARLGLSLCLGPQCHGIYWALAGRRGSNIGDGVHGTVETTRQDTAGHKAREQGRARQ